MEEGKVVYWVLVGNPVLKTTLGRRRRDWEDNINMALQAVGCVCYGLDQPGSGYGKVAGTCE